MSDYFYFNGMSFNYDNKKELKKNSDGSAFIIDNKEQTIDTLINNKIEEKGKGIILYNNSKKRNVYVLYESVPAFDSFDRIYDTSRYLLIYIEDGYLTGIYITMGYQYGSVYVYENISFNDDKTKDIFNSAGIYDDLKHEKDYVLPQF